VMLWDARTQPRPDYWMLDEGEVPVGFIPDFRGLFSRSGDGTSLRQWNGTEVVKSLPYPMPLPSHETLFSPGSRRQYVLKAGDLQVFDANTLKLKRDVKLPPPCHQLSN